MDAFAGAFLVFATILLGSILAAVLVAIWWNIRARRRDRLELKRHVQKIEVPDV
jgi:hypothetical protein